METGSKGKIIPFEQGASFYMKRGAKQMEKNDLLSALNRYRQAYLAAPDDPEPGLAMAEILSQMQLFEESNRLLFMLISYGNGTPECFFGLACNYFGMREYDYAAESLENYLDAEPDGTFAADAEDLLDLLDDDDAMFEMTGLRTDADYDDNASCLFARHLMDGGDYEGAISELTHQLTVSPGCVNVQNQLAIACFCNGETARALEISQKVLEQSPKNVLARCNLALLYHSMGSDEQARLELERILEQPVDAPEELQNVTVLLLELRLFERAEPHLRRLMQLLPYEPDVLHKMGYCRYMLGDFSGAQECYKRLLSIHPDDTVARYYLAQARKETAEPWTMRAKWAIPYQVPFGEAFRRLNVINRELVHVQDDLTRVWQEDEHFRRLLCWALTLPEARVKKAMLSLVYTFADEQAERVLRDFLLRTDQPDDLKRAVFGMLNSIGAGEPYMAYLNGQWIQGRISMLSFPYKLPAAYEEVMQILTQSMIGTCGEACFQAVSRIYRRYIESLRERFPRISEMQAASMAAALEYYGRRAGGEELPPDEIGRIYRVTPTRLRNAMVKLEPFAEEPPTDPEETPQ